MSALTDFSNGLSIAVEKGALGTLLVDARKRYPASGIAYANNLVLTADHVVTRDEDLRIGTPDGKTVLAAIAGRDPGSDLALLRLSDNVLTPAKPAGGKPKVGELVIALGRPSHAGIQASWGIVTILGGPTRTGRGGLLDEYIQTETTSYPGFSGGPLINTEGEVLGLNTSGLGHGMALTLPVKFAWRIAESLSQNGTVKRGYLGIRTQAVEIPAESEKGLKREQKSGLLILWMEEGGPAQRGGLLVGDIIVTIADHPIEDPDELFIALDHDMVGKTIDVGVIRGGKPSSIKVTVGERK